MNRLPLLFRSFVFWTGVLVLLPLVWLWVDSMTFQRHAILSPVPGSQIGVKSGHAAAQLEFIRTPLARGDWEHNCSQLKIDFSHSSSCPIDFGFQHYRHTLTPTRYGGCYPYTMYITTPPAATIGTGAMKVEVNMFTLPYWIAVISFTPPWFLLLSFRMLHRKHAARRRVAIMLAIRRARMVPPALSRQFFPPATRRSGGFIGLSCHPCSSCLARDCVVFVGGDRRGTFAGHPR